LGLFTARAKAQGVAEARKRLQAAMTALRWPVWPAPVTDYYLGKLSLDELLREAVKDADGDKLTTQLRRCEVFEYAAGLQGALGDGAQLNAVSARMAGECPSLPSR
ncbi:MAG: hypothetical protein ACLGI6_12655, partial [Gammaproteobacteria bacterium]